MEKSALSHPSHDFAAEDIRDAAMVTPQTRRRMFPFVRRSQKASAAADSDAGLAMPSHATSTSHNNSGLGNVPTPPGQLRETIRAHVERVRSRQSMQGEDSLTQYRLQVLEQVLPPGTEGNLTGTNICVQPNDYPDDEHSQVTTEWDGRQEQGSSRYKGYELS